VVGQRHGREAPRLGQAHHLRRRIGAVRGAGMNV
jgi:hypothetical protein